MQANSDSKRSGARVSSMKEEMKSGTEARSNRENSERTELDIMKVMQQCGIHPGNWERHIRTENK